MDQDEEIATPVTVNTIPKKIACQPLEVIQMQTESGTFPIVIIYDIRAEVTLCNYEAGQIIPDTKLSNKKITISTINSVQAKLWEDASQSLAWTKSTENCHWKL